MATDLFLFTFSSDKSIESLIDSLSNIQNEDWNGNNGEDGTSDDAIEEGFESDLDYTLDFLHKKYDGKEFSNNLMATVINDYLEDFTGGSGYYSKYKYNIIELENKILLSVALVNEE